MELYNDEVPGREVWAVAETVGVYSNRIEWFLTAAASIDAYRAEVAHWERRSVIEENVRLSRWHVALPKQRMERKEVDVYVEAALTMGTDDVPIRLDVRTFNRTAAPALPEAGQ